MRIVIDPSDYYLGLNLGDVAMTRVAATRLAALWPDASIEILSCSSAILKVVYPGAKAISIAQPALEMKPSWQQALASKLPSPVRESILRNRFKIKLMKLVRGEHRPAPRKYAAEELTTLATADAMVVAGMGSITDVFRDYSFDLFGRMRFALEAGVPVAMVGQGIGPLHDPELRAMAADILPRVTFISLREGRSSLPLLRSLGVPAERVMVTGDDAIELAFEARAEGLGSGLGVNLRTAEYAQLTTGMVDQFRLILHDAAKKFSAPLISIPIDQEDVIATTRLLSGYKEAAAIEAFKNDPQAAFRQIKACRAIMTGSYHAAVFSLSLGVPAVCIAASEYYQDKFLGLADQFGDGCEVVLTSDKAWPEQVAGALDRAWVSAERVRPNLLSSAENQIALGHSAYRKLYDSITSFGERGSIQSLRSGQNRLLESSESGE